MFLNVDVLKWNNECTSKSKVTHIGNCTLFIIIKYKIFFAIKFRITLKFLQKNIPTSVLKIGVAKNAGCNFEQSYDSNLLANYL
jgi:hypothetical protein